MTAPQYLLNRSEYIIAATGHRPNKLGGYDAKVDLVLRSFARTILSQMPKVEVAISGMALGWDQAVAAACIDVGLPWIAAVPFVGFESRWPARSQARYYELIKAATAVHIVCEQYQVEDAGVPWALQERNCWMVDHAEQMLALWDGSTGGTKNCLDYATTKNSYKVLNVWGGYVAYRESGDWLI